MNREQHDADTPMTEEERLQEQLSALLDGELTGDERTAAETAVASDPAAREVFDDLQLIRTTLASLEPVPAPRPFALPAAAARPARRGVFGRFDFVLRLGSVGAALLFVVAMAGGGSLQTASTGIGGVGVLSGAPGEVNGSFESTTTSNLEAPGSADRTGEDMGTAGAEAPEPAPPAAPDAAPEVTTDGDPETLTAPDAPVADDDAPGDAAPDEVISAPADGEDGRSTELGRQTSESIGGTSAALAALAVLLAALSGVITWQRRRI